MEMGAAALPSGFELEGLLEWRPDLGVVTVCVQVEPADRSEGWLIELRKQLNETVATGDDGHQRGRALRATAQRVLDRFGEGEPPSGPCHIGFCEATDRRGARDLWTSAQLRGFRTRVRYAERPQLAPLLQLIDEGAAVGVAAVSAERVHLYEWRVGELELVHDWEAEMYIRDWRERKAQRPANPAREQGPGASGRDRYDQRLEHNRARFLAETGRIAAEEVRMRGWRRLIAFGDPEPVRELAEGSAKKAVEVDHADDANVISEDRGRLLDRVNAAITRSNRGRELALIERAVDGARTQDGLGALGLIDVQRCLNEGRVELLIFDANSRDADLADVEDELIERALRTSAAVTPVEGEAAEALAPHGGVAAVLRYSY
jgi:release factor family 10